MAGKIKRIRKPYKGKLEAAAKRKTASSSEHRTGDGLSEAIACMDYALDYVLPVSGESDVYAIETGKKQRKNWRKAPPLRGLPLTGQVLMFLLEVRACEASPDQCFLVSEC